MTTARVEAPKDLAYLKTFADVSVMVDGSVDALALVREALVRISTWSCNRQDRWFAAGDAQIIAQAALAALDKHASQPGAGRESDQGDPWVQRNEWARRAMVAEAKLADRESDPPEVCTICMPLRLSDAEMERGAVEPFFCSGPCFQAWQEARAKVHGRESPREAPICHAPEEHDPDCVCIAAGVVLVRRERAEDPAAASTAPEFVAAEKALAGLKAWNDWWKQSPTEDKLAASKSMTDARYLAGFEAGLELAAEECEAEAADSGGGYNRHDDVRALREVATRLRELAGHCAWDPVGGRPINPDALAAAAMAPADSSGTGCECRESTCTVCFTRGESEEP